MSLSLGFSLFARKKGGTASVTVTSITPDLGDIAGGSLHIIIGTGFSSATAVSLGGTNAPDFAVISDVEIAVIAPAHAAAASLSVLVTSGGTNVANTLFEYWSPASLNLTGYWDRGGYQDVTAGTWTGLASAGASSGRDLTQSTAANQPTEVSLEASFDGVDDNLVTEFTDWWSLVSASAYTFQFIAEFHSAAAPAAADGDPDLICDTGSNYISVTYTTDGIQAYHLDAGGGKRTTAIPLATGVKACIQVVYNGTDIKCRVNGSSFQTVAAASVSGSGNNVTIGKSSWGLYLDATISFISTCDTALSDATCDKFFKWAQASRGIMGEWAPTDASVPVLAWYRADLGVTESGGRVSALADQSGQTDANRNQVASGADRPGYSASDAGYGGNPVVTFDGSQSVAAAGAFSTAVVGPISILVIGQAAAECAIVGSSATEMVYANVSGEAAVYGPTNGALSSGLSAASPCAILVTDDGTGGGAATKIFVGDLTTAAVSDVTRWESSTLLALGSGGTGGFSGYGRLVGKLAEVIVFGGILTPTDKVALVTYLNTTRAYGLGVSI